MGNRASAQSESQTLAFYDPLSPSLDFPPIAPKDIARLRVESQLIPFIVFATLRAEQSPNGLPPLSPAEAKNLVEILDKVYLPPPILSHALNSLTIRSCHLPLGIQV